MMYSPSPQTTTNLKDRTERQRKREGEGEGEGGRDGGREREKVCSKLVDAYDYYSMYFLTLIQTLILVTAVKLSYFELHEYLFGTVHYLPLGL